MTISISLGRASDGGFSVNLPVRYAGRKLRLTKLKMLVDGALHITLEAGSRGTQPTNPTRENQTEQNWRCSFGRTEGIPFVGNQRLHCRGRYSRFKAEIASDTGSKVEIVTAEDVRGYLSGEQKQIVKDPDSLSEFSYDEAKDTKLTRAEVRQHKLFRNSAGQYYLFAKTDRHICVSLSASEFSWFRDRIRAIGKEGFVVLSSSRANQEMAHSIHAVDEFTCLAEQSQGEGNKGSYWIVPVDLELL